MLVLFTVWIAYSLIKSKALFLQVMTTKLSQPVKGRGETKKTRYAPALFGMEKNQGHSTTTFLFLRKKTVSKENSILPSGNSTFGWSFTICVGLANRTAERSLA